MVSFALGFGLHSVHLKITYIMTFFSIETVPLSWSMAIGRRKLEQAGAGEIAASIIDIKLLLRDSRPTTYPLKLLLHLSRTVSC